MSGQPDPGLQRAYAGFRTLHYMRHNQRRQEHLATLGLDLRDQSVLELGAGVGDHTTFFLDRNCRVVSVEARVENCRFFLDSFRSAGYKGKVELEIVHCDVEHLADQIQANFDIVYCYGLLYHLEDPAACIEAMADRCTGTLLLETMVSFGEEEAINPVTERQDAVTQSAHGRGCRPTRPWIFARLGERFEHVYVPRTQPAHEEFPTDWSTQPPGGGFSRAVFIASRRALDNPMLLDHLPGKQDVCA